MRLFLSAGEASGDAYAAALVEELRKLSDDLRLEGIGGRRLQASLGSLVADSSSWGAISIVQSLAVVPRAAKGYWKAKSAMRRGPRGILVAIDFGFFNIRLCRFAKKIGWRVVYFMPPSSWRRDRQGRDLPEITDSVVTPFPWSEQILRNSGVDAHFFGHPLKQLIATSNVVEDRRSDRLAVLPGSRTHEIERNLPMIADFIAQGKPSVATTLEFALSPNLDAGEVERRWNELAPGRSDLFTPGDTYGVLARGCAAIVCSGTATLEAALMRCPHVVVYRITKAMVREAKIVRFKLPKFIALPNIVLDREVVPELLGVDISPADITANLAPLLAQGEERNSQLAGFEEIDRLLGPADAISRTASLVLSLGNRANPS